MPAGRLELPKASKGRLVYSQVQLPLCDAGQTRNSIVKQQKERVLSALKAQKRPAPFVSSIELLFRDFGSGNPLPLDQLRRREQSEKPCSADFVLPMVFT